MYLKAVDVLKSNAFYHYEIVISQKNSCESKHNLNYWNKIHITVLAALQVVMVIIIDTLMKLI